MMIANDGTEGAGRYICDCCGRTTDSVMVIHKMELCPECATDLMAEAGCPCGGCCG